MQTKINKLAIIAGAGEYPIAIIKQCVLHNINFILLPIIGFCDHFIESKSYPFYLGEIGKVVSVMKENDVTHVIFAGSVKKPSFSDIKTDLLGSKLLARILRAKFLGDNNLLSIILNFLEEYNFTILGTIDVAPDLISNIGVMGKHKPSKKDMIDIEIGRKAAMKLGELDIGQAVIIENKVILSVEGIEGTDALLSRTRDLKLSSKKSGVLLKSLKPGQDKRVDLPSIGPNTVELAINANLAGIAVTASSSIIINKDLVIDLANRNNIFLYGY